MTGFLCILAYNIQDAEQTQIERLFGIALLCVILIHFALMSVAAVVVNNKVSAGYGHYRTGAPPLYARACALKIGVA